MITLLYRPKRQVYTCQLSIYDKRGLTKTTSEKWLPLAWGLHKHGYWRCLYSSRENLKFLKKPRIKVSWALQESKILTRWHQIHHCQESEELWHKNILENFQKAERYYIAYLPDSDTKQISRENQWHSIHWGIECYHRTMKQLCGIERFMVRT